MSGRTYQAPHHRFGVAAGTASSGPCGSSRPSGWGPNGVRGRWFAAPSRRHLALMATVVAVYVLLVAAVATTSPLVALDWRVMLFRPYLHWPQWWGFMTYYVVLGQRGPTATIAAAWLAFRSYRLRSLRPLLVGTTAVLGLNCSVGAVKLGLGRLGPHYATVLGSNELFHGGDIFPSGHTSNSVVTWGMLAYLAVRHRRTAAALATALAGTVGLTTLYLGTHWVSDVLAGWAAGALVLLTLPVLKPVIAALDTRLLHTRRMRRLLGLPPPCRAIALAPDPRTAPGAGTPTDVRAGCPTASPATIPSPLMSVPRR